MDTPDEWELEHDEQDIRGLPLVDAECQKIGVITDLLVDRSKEKVAAVRLEDGRVADVTPLELHDNCVVYGRRAATAAAAAGTAESTGTAESNSHTDVDSEEIIPVVEERVAIGKRVADNGDSISVRTRVVEDTVSKDAVVTDEVVVSKEIDDKSGVSIFVRS